MKPKCSEQHCVAQVIRTRTSTSEGGQLLTVLHHDSEEAHNNLGAGPDQDLAFPTLLSIVDAFKSICENVHAHHDACKTRHA